MQAYDECAIACLAVFNCAPIYSVVNSNLRNPRSKF